MESTSTTTTTPHPQLPPPIEILTEILSKLPAKPLLRFKSVSKSFYSLLTSPEFIKLHLTHPPKYLTYPRFHLIISHSTLSTSPLSHSPFSFSLLPHPLQPIIKPDTLNYFPDPPGVELLGSCNGVLCISNASKTNVFLFSPSTRTSKNLPPAYVPYPDGHVVFGCGYDGRENDYKVLRIIQCRERYCHIRFYNEAKVYSLKEHAWRWVADMPYFLVYKDSHGVLVENGLHFLVFVGDEVEKREKIARFDVVDEVYGVVDCPEFGVGEVEVGKVVLGELGGCLSIVVNYRSGLMVDLWVMKEYGKKESWERVVRIEIRPWCKEVKAVAYSDDERKVLVVVDHCQLHWCDLGGEDGKAKIVVGSNKLFDEPFNAGVYVESVVSLDDWGSVPKKHEKKSGLDEFLSVGFNLKL